MKSTTAEMLLLVISVIWATTYVFTKIGLDYTSPSSYLVIRFTVTLIILLALFGKHLKYLDKTTAWHGAVLGFFFGVGFLLQTFALKVTTVEKSAFITGLCGVTTPIIYWLIARKAISFVQKIAIAVSTTGLLIFTHPNMSNINYGDILLLISTFVWSFYLYYMNVFTRIKCEGFSRDANLILFTYFVTMPIAVFSAVFIEGGGMSVVFAPMLVVSLAFNIIFASILATFLQTRFQKYTTPVRASMIFTVEPVFTAIISYFSFRKPMTLLEMCGGAVMLAGMLAMYWLPAVIKKARRYKVV